jgi:hypothetical protein
MIHVSLGRKKATRFYSEDDFMVVQLYSTKVVKWNNSKIILNSGGWQTQTTKARINQASWENNLGISVSQVDSNWYVYKGYEVIPFVDGMTISR